MDAYIRRTWFSRFHDSKTYYTLMPFTIKLEKPKKKELFKQLKEKADIAAKTGAELGKKAVEKGPAIGKQFKEKGLEALEDSIEAARKASASGDRNIELLKKLAELKSVGIITEKEFEAKKKEILERI